MKVKHGAFSGYLNFPSRFQETHFWEMTFKAWWSVSSFLCCQQSDFCVVCYSIFWRESCMPCSLIFIIVSFRPSVPIIRPRVIAKDRRTLTKMPDHIKMRTQKSGCTLKIHCAYPFSGVLGLLLKSKSSWKRTAFIRVSYTEFPPLCSPLHSLSRLCQPKTQPPQVGSCQ